MNVPLFNLVRRKRNGWQNVARGKRRGWWQADRRSPFDRFRRTGRRENVVSVVARVGAYDVSAGKMRVVRFGGDGGQDEKEFPRTTRRSVPPVAAVYRIPYTVYRIPHTVYRIPYTDGNR